MTPRRTHALTGKTLSCVHARTNRLVFWWEPTLRLPDLGLTPNLRLLRVTGRNEDNSSGLDIAKIPAAEAGFSLFT